MYFTEGHIELPREGPHQYFKGSVFVFVFYALLCVLSSFAFILKRKRELVAFLLLSCGCLVTVNVL